MFRRLYAESSTTSRRMGGFSGNFGLSVDEVFLQVQELEGRRYIQQRLGMAEQEHTAGNETFVEHLDDALSCRRVEIEDHVPTEDDIASSYEVRTFLVEQVHLA